MATPLAVLQYTTVPLCASNRGRPAVADCSNYSSDEKWPPNFIAQIDNEWRHPKANGNASICDAQCLDPDSPGAQCTVIAVPRSSPLLSSIAPTPEKLAAAYQYVRHDANFPITSTDFQRVLGIDPTTFGRPQQISINKDLMTQAGQPVSFTLNLSTGNQPVNGALDLPGTLSGLRQVENDYVNWRFDSSTGLPSLRIDGDPVDSGDVVAAYITERTLMFEVSDRCDVFTFQEK